MPFEEAVTLLPTWVQYWMNVFPIVMLGCMLVLVFAKPTRRDALIVFVPVVLSVVIIFAMYGQMGMVRLLGLGHVVLWTPVVIYLYRRWSSEKLPSLQSKAVVVLGLTMVAVLVFDYLDVIRWLLGERGSVV